MLLHNNSLIPVLPCSQSRKKKKRTPNRNAKTCVATQNVPSWQRQWCDSGFWISSHVLSCIPESFLVSAHSEASCLLGHVKKIFPFQKQRLYLDLEAIDLPGLHFWGIYKTSAVVAQPDLDGNSSDGKHIGAIHCGCMCCGSCVPLCGSLFETVKGWLIPNGLIPVPVGPGLLWISLVYGATVVEN